ncbi:MAG: hypothetical protein LQ350_000398 [Teloschistes chrysophthalmus]|nr:MAG: hypothetical protein LQ350_000398 [Niorma chrysophthalma]
MDAVDMIDYLLQNHVAPTTMIVCSSREQFLEKVQLSIKKQESSDSMPHPLLLPTIHQLATSRTVQMAFVPTLPHLRAYSSSFTAEEGVQHGSAALAKPGSQVSMLAVYGFLNLHQCTTEYSVQGLSRSLALAVEAADACKMQLVLVEDPGDWEIETSELDDETEARPARDVWKEQVPILNSSLALSDDRAWAGRTVDIGAIVRKWCVIKH